MLAYLFLQQQPTISVQLNRNSHPNSKISFLSPCWVTFLFENVQGSQNTVKNKTHWIQTTDLAQDGDRKNGQMRHEVTIPTVHFVLRSFVNLYTWSFMLPEIVNGTKTAHY
jgi:hypothetical protein